ncbi:hypothetical protein F7725_006055 [Dissostichus mawsoni]|uniref:Uncharacterized protein n=1 Tax=Dissostichus mawsoni TaxID=36200 RepID=A0A7J5YTC5_DISMA|nr:hypothetical protein F7725_006055 [Dissostichus mawsoni]
MVSQLQRPCLNASSLAERSSHSAGVLPLFISTVRCSHKLDLMLAPVYVFPDNIIIKRCRKTAKSPGQFPREWKSAPVLRPQRSFCSQTMPLLLQGVQAPGGVQPAGVRPHQPGHRSDQQPERPPLLRPGSNT